MRFVPITVRGLKDAIDASGLGDDAEVYMLDTDLFDVFRVPTDGVRAIRGRLVIADFRVEEQDEKFLAFDDERAGLS